MSKSLLLDWQSLEKCAPFPMNSTLGVLMLFPGSFMTRLAELGIDDATIHVTSENWSVPELDEVTRLGMELNSLALVREVLIGSLNKQWMYARTIFPKETLTQEQIELANLKNRSLGTVLFKENTWTRSEFEFTTIEKDGAWFAKINNHIPLKADSLWGRRSVFSFKTKKLLLTEIFLPDLACLT